MNPTTNAPAAIPAPCDPLRLVSFIRTRSHGQVRNLRLEVRGAGLILCGSTTTYYAKQLAHQAVLEAGELPLLANEIEVTIASETRG